MVATFEVEGRACIDQDTDLFGLIKENTSGGCVEWRSTKDSLMT